MSTVESKNITLLKQILDELKSIKTKIKPNNELKELKERLNQLEARVTVLEACNIHQSPITSPFTNPYQSPIIFDQGVPPSSPLFPQVMGNSNTENISELSKEIDSSMPNIVNKPHISKEFKKK